MTAADRLAAAMVSAALPLADVVGMPSEFEGAPRCCFNGSPVIDRQKVPEAAWVAACAALDYLCVGIGLMDADAPSLITVEEGLAAMTKGRPAS